MAIKVAIVEDNSEICDNLSQLLGESTDLSCICMCRNCRSALVKIPASAPDVIVMDIHLPDGSGVDLTARLKQLLPRLHILMYTIRDDDEQIFRALQAGAAGYLLKSTPPHEILGALREVVRGGGPMTSEIARKVIHSFYRPQSEIPQLDALTPRETAVMDLLIEGHASKEIADRLSVSVETVNYHLKQIYQKMHVRSRTEAVVKYLRH